jgi:hypothetical protein
MANKTNSPEEIPSRIQRTGTFEVSFWGAPEFIYG